MVLEQIHDREDTFSYPNEEIDEIISVGISLWDNEIDLQGDHVIPRWHLDEFLVKHNIVKDYKEVNRFLAGVLSGTVVRRHEHMRRSYF